MPPKRNRLTVLCTDLASIRAITEGTSRFFDLLWTRDLNGLMVSLKADPTPVAAIVDHAVAHDKSIDLLNAIRTTFPRVRRILVSDYCDLGLIVQGLHTGAVERIVYKPIHAPELLGAIGAENLPASLITPGAPQTRSVRPRVVG
jgi:ActR/RegA family two-component response regulator